MKKIITIILLLNISNIFSQESGCLKTKLYNSTYDLVEIKDTLYYSTDDYETEKLQLVVMLDEYIDFSTSSRYGRLGVNKGFKVVLINDTLEDFSLVVNREGKIATDREVFFENEWRSVVSPIKRSVRWCTIVRKERFIQSGKSLTFASPCIDGEIKVKFRFVAFNRTGNSVIVKIISNEFDGFIDKNMISNL